MEFPKYTDCRRAQLTLTCPEHVNDRWRAEPAVAVSPNILQVAAQAQCLRPLKFKAEFKASLPPSLPPPSLHPCLHLSIFPSLPPPSPLIFSHNLTNGFTTPSPLTPPPPPLGLYIPPRWEVILLLLHINSLFFPAPHLLICPPCSTARLLGVSRGVPFTVLAPVQMSVNLLL